jgi:pimeloyl-ACP methyl ester carboxylesterase
MLLGLAGFVAVVYLGLCAALFFLQRSLIYFPQPRSVGTAVPTLRLAVPGAEVLVTTRARSGPDALIYFGGNAEDVSLALPELATAFPDRALYLMHYRGYGGSSGRPSEAALVADALALFDRVQPEHANVLVVGRSLGSGVAIQLASARPVARLVLVTPYDSIQALAAQQFPWAPVRWLLQDRFESWRHAPRIAVPTLLIAAEHDEVIPMASTRALFARFRSGTAVLEVVSGAGHNDLSARPDYVTLLHRAR